jgi:CheY-like chemotaxis protein
MRLVDFIARVLPSLRQGVPPPIEIRWLPHPSVGDALVRADPDQLKQALLHLCANACDAIGARTGTISLTLERQRLPDGLAVSRLEDSYLALTVTDDGAGMEADTAARVFEPFYSGKEGHGLGLSLVAGIVAGHSGFVDVASKLGEGSSFTLYLPEHDDRAVQDGPEAPLILLAEDEPGVRKIVGKILKHAGYRVLPAANGNEAVELLERHKDEVALVMLDAVMPGLGGEDVFRRLQELRPELPVVLSSGYSQGSWPPSLLERDRVAVLTKPYDPADLLHALEKLLPAGQAPEPRRR